MNYTLMFIRVMLRDYIMNPKINSTEANCMYAYLKSYIILCKSLSADMLIVTIKLLRNF